jgi:hypothetical protein
MFRQNARVHDEGFICMKWFPQRGTQRHGALRARALLEVGIFFHRLGAQSDFQHADLVQSGTSSLRRDFG